MINEEKTKLYLIESGPMLELIKHHLNERTRVTAVNLEILRKLGLDPEKVQLWRHIYNGSLTGVQIPKSLKMPKVFVQENWTKPDSKGRRRPKKGTEEYKAFYSEDALFTPAETLIVKALNVPTSIGYKTRGGTRSGEGWSMIGRMMSACGFLWMDRDNGPYAMWLPDVEAAVEDLKKAHKGVKSFEVIGGADVWQLDTTGIKPLLQEEWDLMVAQKNLEEAREKAAKRLLFDSLPPAGKKNIKDAVKEITA